MAIENLQGNYWVRSLRSAFPDAEHWLPKSGDRARLRRHAVNLCYFPEHHPVTPSGSVFDLDWSIVQGMTGLKIYELRINETIGDCDNLRVIFHVGPPDDRYPKTILWILTVFQKKRNDFSPAQLQAFRDRRLIIHERFYPKS